MTFWLSRTPAPSGQHFDKKVLSYKLVSKLVEGAFNYHKNKCMPPCGLYCNVVSFLHYLFTWNRKGVDARFRDEVRVDLLTAGSQAVSLAVSWNKGTPEPVQVFLQITSLYIHFRPPWNLLLALSYSCCLLHLIYMNQNVTILGYLRGFSVVVN